jgi:putative addiction module component (TIGR02574 family)
MLSASEMIFEQALKLPENERLTLASRLLDTVPADDSAIALDDASLVEELDRRFGDREGSVAWSDLRAEK